MTKREMLDYANEMAEDEEVFAIIYSMQDVIQWFRDENHATLIPPDEDIYEALRCWSDNMDLSCSTNLTGAFSDLCEELLDNEKKRTQ
jgi:hypothetical protein